MSRLLTSTSTITHSDGGVLDGIRDGEASEAARQARAAWRRLIDFTLIEWGRNLASLEDDGLAPPQRLVIRWAIQIAERLAEQGAPSPTRTVPNGDGGLVFELAHGGSSEVLELEYNGTVFHSVFLGSRLVHRAVWAQLQD